MIAAWVTQQTDGTAPPILVWILATGFWNDGGEWIDTDVWID